MKVLEDRCEKVEWMDILGLSRRDIGFQDLHRHLDMPEGLAFAALVVRSTRALALGVPWQRVVGTPLVV